MWNLLNMKSALNDAFLAVHAFVTGTKHEGKGKNSGLRNSRRNQQTLEGYFKLEAFSALLGHRYLSALLTVKRARIPGQGFREQG